MISKDHKKHSQIAKPSLGHFGRNEWAIVGGQCNEIKALADEVFKSLTPKYKCAYADARHKKEEEDTSLPGRLESGSFKEYINEIEFHQFNLKDAPNQFQFREIFMDADLILVNGNHHQAKAQVVVIDEKKKQSLQKRLPELTNVQLILFADGSTEIFDFIKEKIPAWEQIPKYTLSDRDKITNFFRQQIDRAKPVLNGLVLAGGKSTRMGFDKGLIQWKGQEHQYWLADSLKSFCSEVFISCRTEQSSQIKSQYAPLPDSFVDLGPLGAILSAFRHNPDAAWLVVACDLPLLDEAILETLSKNRNPSSMATAFESPFDGLPEPLITIWEPKSYSYLLSYLSQGHTCPRKALRNNHVTLLKALNPDALMNVNTPEEFEQVKQIIQKKLTEA